MAARTLLAALTALLLAACAGSDPAATEPSPAASPPTPSAASTPTPAPGASGSAASGTAAIEAAWHHLASVEAALPGMVMAEALTDQEALAEAWEERGFGVSEPAPGATPATRMPPPTVDFDHRFVLLLAQPDDACLDELVGLEVIDGELVAEWLPPPGPCAEPLIFRLHAINVHRGHVPSTFIVSPPEPYTGDLEPVEVTLESYDGDAPPPPSPPGRMSEADVDALFEATAVTRCAPEELRLGEPQLDGPLSDDPEIAEAQQRRAEQGLPSGIAATREALAGDAGHRDDAPMTDEEVQAERERSALADRAGEVLEAAGIDPGRDVEIVIDRYGAFGDDRGVHVFVGGDEVTATQQLLDAEVGPGRVRVTYSGFDPAEQRRVQDSLTSLMRSGETGPGAITSISGSIGPVVVGMVDPTREALEEIAATVDPRLVCVEPLLTGVAAPN